MNKVYSRAYTEILEIIKYLPHDEYEKIPNEKIEFYKKNRDSSYQFKYNPLKSLNEQNVLRETKVLIVDLFEKVIATDDQKEKLYIILNRNEQEYQNELAERYSYEALFSKKEENVEDKKVQSQSINNSPVLVKKENIFLRIYNFFKRIFSKEI